MKNTEIKTEVVIEKMFFSGKTGGFYSNAIHTDIPDDAVEITKEYHQELLVGQSEGKLIVADTKGYPVLQDQPPLTDEQLQAQTNAKALSYLAETDWYVIRYTETGVGVPADITAKRSEARVSIK